MLRLGMEMKDGPKLRKLLDETSIDFRDGDIILDGEIVSRLIRTQEVSMAASGCSAFPIVREKMVDVQQKMGESKSVIMDGRDICEVVFPNARYKYFITAEPEERAKRRYKELIDKGQKISYEEVLTQIRQRDLNDSTRSASPMKKSSRRRAFRHHSHDCRRGSKTYLRPGFKKRRKSSAKVLRSYML